MEAISFRAGRSALALTNSAESADERGLRMLSPRKTLSAVVCLMLVAGTSAASQAAGQSRPNILWISAEDLSPDLGCYGDTYARTPNLDKFASESVRFTR